MNYDRKNKAILCHADISRQYFLVCHLKILFNCLHELKQRSSDVTGWPVVSDVTEGLITIQSTGNQMKFRLKKKTKTKQKTSDSFNPFVPGNFGEKGILKLAKPFSSHSLAIKS